MNQYQAPLAIALSVYAPMVRAYNSIDDPDSAQEVLDIATGMIAPPIDQFLAFNEADILIKRGDLEGAEAAVQRGETIIDQFKLEDARYLVFMLEGFLNRRKGDFESSSEAFQSALDQINRSVLGGSDLYQELPALQAELAESRILSGHLDAAEKALEEGFRLDPNEPLLWLTKARFQLASGLPQLAQASVNYALAIWNDADPEYEDVISARALQREISLSLPTG